MKIQLLLATAAALLASSTSTVSSAPSSLVHQVAEPGTWDSFTLPGTGITYRTYTPSYYGKNKKGGAGKKEKVPLIMNLHGCTQNSTVYAATTQYAGLAETQNFITVFPSQDPAVLATCWKWFEPTSQVRGGGDAAVLASIVDVMKTNPKWNIDPKRVHVAGLSAGAAMSVVMGVTYPDYFASIAVGAGLEFAAGDNIATTSLTVGGPDPAQQAQLIVKVMGSAARVQPTIVFTGTNDTRVYPLNGDQVVKSMLYSANLISPKSHINTQFFGGSSSTNFEGQDIKGANKIKKETVPIPNGRTYTRYTWDDKKGDAVVEYLKIDGMAHAWSAGMAPGVGGTYADATGPDATVESYKFFMNHPMKK